MLIDTHAHLHFRDAYKDNLDQVLANAKAVGVETIINVGVDEADSYAAVELAKKYDHIYATVGLHPHDAKERLKDVEGFKKLAQDSKVVAIGECGLDYFRNLSPKAEQEEIFRQQIELALEIGKPMVWHVRDAFDDFFRIVDDYSGLKGIVHCFTSNRADMQKAVDRGFLVALNGIMTFTKDPNQLEAAKALPLDHLVLETDCPFLTPAPHRGKPNEPAFVKLTAEFLAKLRGESYDELASVTTANAKRLLGIN